MAKKKAAGEKYRALNGINWPNPAGGEFRAERGDLIRAEDLPEEIAKGFLEASPDRPADLESLEEVIAPAGEAAAEEEK